MELGLDKCTKIVLKSGKLVHWQESNDMYQQRNTRAEPKTPTNDSLLRKVAVCNVNK
jgi:hypothetical protein